MTLPTSNLQRIAAFSIEGTGGNPAGVLILEQLPGETEMQAIAAQVGFSETVFAAPGDPAWTVRYFSPESEVPFCGHATIALGAALALERGDGVFHLQLRHAQIGAHRTSALSPRDAPKRRLARRRPQLQIQPKVERRRSPAQGFESEPGIVGIEQAVQQGSAGLHPSRHRNLGDFRLLHGLGNLPGNHPLHRDRRHFVVQALLDDKAVET